MKYKVLTINSSEFDRIFDTMEQGGFVLLGPVQPTVMGGTFYYTATFYKEEKSIAKVKTHERTTKPVSVSPRNI